MAAGFVAGALSSVVLQPLDVVKTRMQSRSGSSNAARVAMQIWQTEGWRVLWAGVVPSTVRLAGGIALYFLLLGEVEAMSRRLLGQLSGSTAAIRDFLVGAISRGLAGALFCPITVLKTRAEDGVSTSGGMLEQLITLGRMEGAAGLFAGLGPSLLRDVPYSGISLTLLRRFREPLLALGSDLLPAALIGGLAGCASAACATLLTQPADVVRTELVLHSLKDQRINSLRAIGLIVRSRGVGALFAGTTARLARRMLQQAFTWAVYEAVVVK